MYKIGEKPKIAFELAHRTTGDISPVIQYHGNKKKQFLSKPLGAVVDRWEI